MKIKAAIVLAFALFSICPSIFAHHGNAAFDLTRFVTLKATITEFVWSNPHSQIYFDVTNDKGQVIHWTCETVQPALLHRAGWTRESLKPGDQVTIVAHPAKSGEPIAYLSGGKIILANGNELKMDIPQS